MMVYISMIFLFTKKKNLTLMIVHMATISMIASDLSLIRVEGRLVLASFVHPYLYVIVASG